jgi:hypothetical protein
MYNYMKFMCKMNALHLAGKKERAVAFFGLFWGVLEVGQNQIPALRGVA